MRYAKPSILARTCPIIRSCFSATVLPLWGTFAGKSCSEVEPGASSIESVRTSEASKIPRLICVSMYPNLSRFCAKSRLVGQPDKSRPRTPHGRFPRLPGLGVRAIVHDARGGADYTGGVNHTILPKIRVVLLL